MEFAEKKLAKLTALSLNNTPLGGPKGSYYREDIWNIKYLKGFKWHHLTEKIAFESRMRTQKMLAEVAQAKRDSNFYVQQLERAREISKIEERKLASKTKNKESKSSGVAAKAGLPQERKVHRTFSQRTPVPKSAASGNQLMHSSILKSILRPEASTTLSDKPGKRRRKA